MYHALVCRNGRWISYGVHVPSSQWSDFFRTLGLLYGEENVSYSFWEVDDALDKVSNVRARIEFEISSANQL